MFETKLPNIRKTSIKLRSKTYLAEIVSDIQPSTVFAKDSIFNIWRGSECDTEDVCLVCINYSNRNWKAGDFIAISVFILLRFFKYV